MEMLYTVFTPERSTVPLRAAAGAVWMNDFRIRPCSTKLPILFPYFQDTSLGYVLIFLSAGVCVCVVCVR